MPPHVVYAAAMTAPMDPAHDGPLLDALLDSWRRNNLILINLLQALPESAMDLRATDGSPRVAQLFMHMHYCRLVFVHETAPEVGAVVPTGEWRRGLPPRPDQGRAQRSGTPGRCAGRERDPRSASLRCSGTAG